MRIETMKSAMNDELRKIAGINLMGLSPGNVLGARMAQPLETPGTQKAMEAIQRAAEIQPPQVKLANKAKSFNRKYLAPGLSGAATGTLLSSLLIPPRGKDLLKITKTTYKARLLGAAIGAAINILSKQAMISPAMGLRSSQRIGTTVNKIKAGPRLSTQIRGSLVGQKGTIPGV
jgi:hypothetical protein